VIPPGIRRRLMWAFALQALMVCALFSLLGLVLVYSLEDTFFERLLREEAQLQQAHHAGHGQWTAPSRPFMQVHLVDATLPPAVRGALADNPRRREFAGEQGRHYHLWPLHAHGQPPAWLLAEVSDYLVVRPARGGILRFLGLASALVFVLALGLGFWLAHRTLRPLAGLARSVQQAPQGLLPAGFAADYPPDEIGALARALDEAMQRVAGFLQREQRFTADASHELRTPLAVVAGAAELLRSRGDLPEPAMKAVQRIELACRQMQQAVETLLTLAREADGDAAAAALDLRALVDEVLTTQRRSQGLVTLVNEVAEGVELATPEAPLRLVIANLVGNALQHGGGAVRVGWAGGQLTVRDHGPGVPPALLPRLHEAGVKGEHSAGFGLGLAIVHRLCERQGWQLQVRNEPGGGACVAVRLSAE